MSSGRPQPGQEAYDTATGRVGVLQAICDVRELIFDHRMPGPRVAFLRPVRGGQEWTTDLQNITFPEGTRPRSDADEYGTPGWTKKGTPS